MTVPPWMNGDCEEQTLEAAIYAAECLRELDRMHPGFEGRMYAFGDHVSDPVAIIRRYLTIVNMRNKNYG